MLLERPTNGIPLDLPQTVVAPPAAVEVAGDFRTAMRGLASTVCVVTASDGDSPAGITMTSVASVSMDPPTLLICVRHATSLGAMLKVGDAFCVNVLRAGQQAEAAAFGGAVKALERFSIGDWRDSPEGMPYLANAQANIFCEIRACPKVGTHLVAVGQVTRVNMSGEVAPLLYSDGRYAAIEPGSPPAVHAPASGDGR